MATALPIRFASISLLRAAHLDLLKRHRGPSDSSRFLDAVEQFVRDAQMTGLLLDRDADQEEAQKIIDLWVTRLYRSGREFADSTLAAFDELRAPELRPDQRPYVGFDAFSEQQRQLFCGRDGLTSELVQRLRTSNLMALVGPSGSGKSSLMLAGVVPALKSGGLPGSGRWVYLPRMVPGSDPLRHLVAAVAGVSVFDAEWEEAQVARLHEDPTHFVALLDSL